MLLVACGAVGGRRCCWWPAELLVAIGSAGGPRLLCVSPLLRITAACYALTDATAAAIAAHAAAAACAARRAFRSSLLGGDSCAKTHGSSKPLNGYRTARGGVSRTGQRPSGCARWRHAAYPARTPCRVRGGRQCGERRCVQLCYAGRPSPHISQCCKYSTPLIPSRLPGRYVALPVILNGQYIHYAVLGGIPLLLRQIL